MILLKLLSIENWGILHLFNVLRCILFISPLGLDRHIQALCVRVQWIWQSTASGLSQYLRTQITEQTGVIRFGKADQAINQLGGINFRRRSTLWRRFP